MDNIKKENDLILIVDDIPENLQLLGNVLREANYRVAFATSGKQALTILNTIVPDLILLDITMPEMDGFSVCSKIKEIEKLQNVPVLFLTAHTNKDDVVKGFELGAVDYITKPFNSQELKARIKTHLDLKKSKEKILKQYEELNTLNKELQELITSRDQFYSIIAHDLRSPFNTILGFLQLILEDYYSMTDEDKYQFINNIYTSAQNLHNLLEKLLSWIRSQTGRLKLNPENFDLNFLVNEILPLYHSGFEKKNINYNFYPTDNLIVFADTDTVSTVIRNLISNAIKFTPQNGRITMRTYSENDFAIFSINDTGMGMSPEDLEKLFIPGKKVVKLGTEKETGTGLGLILTKEFVEKNNGKIWVESKLNVGTTFYFSVPLKK